MPGLFYAAHSSEPSFHSCRRPKIKIVKNNSLPINRNDIFVLYKIKGIGTSKTISMSNTMKIIARRKKRIENGIRALWLGSNPHSNGEDFSRSVRVRTAKIQDRTYRINGIIIAIIEDTNNKVIN